MPRKHLDGDSMVDALKEYESTVVRGTRFKSMVLKMLALRGDRGSDIKSDAVKRYCDQHGIHQQYSAAYTKEQSGSAESTNDAIERPANVLVQGAYTYGKGSPSFGPAPFWAHASDWVCYTRGRAPLIRDLNGKTPWEQFYGE